MNTRQIATQYRLSQWAQAFQEKKAAGENIDEFCKAKGISRNTYFYWQRKLREAVVKQAISENNQPTQPTQALTPAQAQVSVPTQVSPPKGWVVCAGTEVEPKTSGSAIQVEIGKSRIMADKDTDLEVLAKVCRVLVSLC